MAGYVRIRTTTVFLVDDREGSRNLLACPVLQGRGILGRLEFGDVMLTGHGPNASTISVGVEVKSVSDLLSSISTGRLGGHQIPGMLKSYDHSWLLVYGVVRAGNDNSLEVQGRNKTWRKFHIGKRPVPWSYLEGFLLTATLISPLRIKWCYDYDEAAMWLAVLDRWLDKPWDKHRGLSVFDTSGETAAPPGSDPTEAQIAKTAASLPNIGWDRAWKAAQHFDSVLDMVTAPESEWRTISGIGPVIAKTVNSTIRRKK